MIIYIIIVQGMAEMFTWPQNQNSHVYCALYLTLSLNEKKCYLFLLVCQDLAVGSKMLCAVTRRGWNSARTLCDRVHILAGQSHLCVCVCVCFTLPVSVSWCVSNCMGLWSLPVLCVIFRGHFFLP